MDTKVRKCLIPEDVILQYHLSYLPDRDAILGVSGRYMYIEITGFLPVPDADNANRSVDRNGVIVDHIMFEGEVIDKIVILRVTISEFQRLFKLWILGKKRICEFYGHWCGAYGNIHIEEFKVVGYQTLTRFDNLKDVDDPEFVYYEQVPIIQVIRWDDTPDFEHG